MAAVLDAAAADSTPAPAGPDTRQVTLEFELPPSEIDRLLRTPAVAARREGRTRAGALQIIWHDTGKAELFAAGLSLGEQQGAWRLEPLRPGAGHNWHPGTRAPLLEEATAPGLLVTAVPGPLMPVAAFSGRLRVASLAGPATLSILDGTLRGVASDKPACRLLLAGAAPDMAALAVDLTATFALTIPRAGLAAEAIAVASGLAPRPRRSGTARVDPDMTVDAALEAVTAHLVDVILYWSRLASSGDTAEPVHQMRVAVRRLRSAISVFRRAAGPALDAVGGQLRDLAAALGPARDWDVFVEGTGAAVGRAFKGDRRVEALLAVAERRRCGAYLALATTLGSAGFRQLAMTLALLPTTRPWTNPQNDPLRLAGPARAYAVRMLDHRLRHVTAPGRSLEALSADARHDVRKQAKRLRYAAEFFAPLFADKTVRRFLKRLERLQEALGTLNDAAVTKTLLAQLGSGTDRAFAGGAVQGFVAAHSLQAAAEVEQLWRKFRRTEVFWR